MGVSSSSAMSSDRALPIISDVTVSAPTPALSRSLPRPCCTKLENSGRGRDDVTAVDATVTLLLQLLSPFVAGATAADGTFSFNSNASIISMSLSCRVAGAAVVAESTMARLVGIAATLDATLSEVCAVTRGLLTSVIFLRIIITTKERFAKQCVLHCYFRTETINERRYWSK